MKYKIRITTYKTGRSTYTPFVQMRWLIFTSWRPLDYEGRIWITEDVMDARGKALKAIDRHYAGNCEVSSTVFEYITK